MHRVRRGFKIEVAKDLLTVDTCHTASVVYLKMFGPKDESGNQHKLILVLDAEQVAKLRAALGLVLEERKDEVGDGKVNGRCA